MNRDLIPKYTLRGESYIDFHGLGYKTYIFSFKAEEILNTVSLNHLYDVLKEVIYKEWLWLHLILNKQ